MEVKKKIIVIVNYILYKFNNQNIGIANVIEISTAKIVRSLIFINCSNLK